MMNNAFTVPFMTLVVYAFLADEYSNTWAKVLFWAGASLCMLFSGAQTVVLLWFGSRQRSQKAQVKRDAARAFMRLLLPPCSHHRWQLAFHPAPRRPRERCLPNVSSGTSCLLSGVCCVSPIPAHCRRAASTCRAPVGCFIVAVMGPLLDVGYYEASHFPPLPSFSMR